MNMYELETMLESYLFPTGKAKLQYMALTEAEKKVFTKDMVTKLFDAVKNKSYKVNYNGLERTKGDITRYPAYDDIENAVDILNRMYNADPENAPKQILSCVKTLDIIKKKKADFMEGFTQNNQPIIMLYTNMCAALIAGSSKIVSVTIEYVKQPSGNYKACFKDKTTNLDKDIYFKSLDRFNLMDKNGQLNRLFDMSRKISESGYFANLDYDNLDRSLLFEDETIYNEGKLVDNIYDYAMKRSKKDLSFVKTNSLDGDSGGGFIILLVTFVLAMVLVLIYTLPYYFYRLRYGLSHYLLELAYLVEENAKEIDTSTEEGKKAREKQEKIVEKLRVLGNKISIEDENAQEQAIKDEEKDEKKIQDESKNSSSEDDEDILL